MTSKTFHNTLQSSVSPVKPARWMKTGLLATSMVLSLWSCKNDFENIKKFSNITELPYVMAEGYEVIYSDSTVIKYKIKTPEIIMHNNTRESYTEFPQGVVITQYDNHMNITSHITSRYAKYFDADDRWEAKNEVVVINPQGDTLKTDYLVWDRKKGKIFSDQFVKIIQKDRVTMGTSFEANQDFTEYTFKNLKGEMYVDVEEK
ncbi:MAG TPA: LPS export ABC transporter periplasmic protein LptC [Prolixibacteraceae bacterium]|nr:LPS export ABC transporter periplasmic protein LptC [Prolixibacteraceae bacterium]